MAGPSRRANPSLIDALQREPGRFDFFQAVTILESVAAERRTRASTEAAQQGLATDPADEPVRLQTVADFSFAPTAVTALAAGPPTEDGEAGQPVMTVAFMGLTGPAGLMPEHYTELLLRETREDRRKPYLKDFFDLFNHRILSLFFRAWRKYRLAANYHREVGGKKVGGAARGLTQVLSGVAGVGTPAVTRRLSLPDPALLYYAGLFSNARHSAAGLAALLSDYFELPVAIDQFDGRWIDLAPDECSRISTSADPRGCFAQLDVDAVVGDRVWSVQSGFRIRIGPLSYPAFHDFLPGGADFIALTDLVRLYAGLEFSATLQLTLARDAVPECQITADAEYGPRLGWNTWVEHGLRLSDRSETCLTLNSMLGNGTANAEIRG